MLLSKHGRLCPGQPVTVEPGDQWIDGVPCGTWCELYNGASGCALRATSAALLAIAGELGRLSRHLIDVEASPQNEQPPEPPPNPDGSRPATYKCARCDTVEEVRLAAGETADGKPLCSECVSPPCSNLREPVSQ